ncbi:MAG: bifunctional [glutamate--ammonia ligase]-adenylyl-L-tyrosine phosphorylase/[glutamate--ammonia-ligase] adenylyltransferase [Burkholderiaceae bacterium]
MIYSAQNYSDYFRRCLQAFGHESDMLQHLNALIGQPVDSAAICATHERIREGLGADVSLRRLRRLVMMALMERDIGGQATLAEVCEAMTSLAEYVTTEAIGLATTELQADFGTPRDAAGRPIDLIAVGMGKAGARELNVSSDLDLVFLIREDGETDGLDRDGRPSRRSPLSAYEFAHRVVRRVIGMLSEATAEGFVFRVDTRLRPNGDSGPLVTSFGALEAYLQVQGREWERFAWLKGRVIATGPLADGATIKADLASLHKLVEPFVFRRYLDYEIFPALRELHSMIRQEARKRDARRAEGFDVKLGRGGIREIEFIAQLFQIVRGGKDRGLRHPATVPTLRRLAERGLLANAESQTLIDAYNLLRRTEHMVQYREDQQTHFLPAEPTQRAQVAAMLGLTAEAFEAALADAVAQVESVFDALLSPGGNGDSSDNEATPTMNGDGDHGPIDAETRKEIERHFKALVDGPRYQSAKPNARQAIDALLAQARGAGIDLPGAIRLTQLLEAICRRPAYLALLAQYPHAFTRVLDMLQASEWAARFLTRHPVLLDELIDGNLFEAADLAAWQNDLAEQVRLARIDGEPDTERQMDLAREFQHAQMFRVLARDLADVLTIEQVSDDLSEIADRILEVAIATVWSQLRQKFREVPRFAAIAYGRLGGKELGYASDLDLVFLFQDDDPHALEAYTKLAQRVSTWLSAQTPAGQLYEIDLRLRPNGEAGMLVSSVSAFEDYQRKSAWVWEHQALTRARFCAGDKSVGDWFETFRRTLISEQRDLATLRDDILLMRKKMHDGHPNRTARFDLKHDSGGMVDIEFMVQYLVLGHAHEHPVLAGNIGNIALLGKAAGAGLIDADLAGAVADAYRKYRRLQHALRMQGASYARVDPEKVTAERDAVTRLWTGLLRV